MKNSNQLLEEIREALAQEGAISDEPLAALELVSERLGASWSAFWVPEPATGLLRMKCAWNFSNFHFEELEADSRRRAISPGEGMPGAVWKSGTACWSNDIVQDMMLPRSLQATRGNLRFGTWIPVQNQGEIIGVLELLSCRADPPDAKWQGFLQELGHEVGRWLAVAAPKPGTPA